MITNYKLTLFQLHFSSTNSKKCQEVYRKVSSAPLQRQRLHDQGLLVHTRPDMKIPSNFFQTKVIKNWLKIQRISMNYSGAKKVASENFHVTCRGKGENDNVGTTFDEHCLFKIWENKSRPKFYPTYDNYRYWLQIPLKRQVVSVVALRRLPYCLWVFSCAVQLAVQPKMLQVFYHSLVWRKTSDWCSHLANHKRWSLTIS